MKIKAQHRALYVIEPERLVSNNIKQYTVEFTLSDEWQGYAPVAVFVDMQGRTVEVVPVAGKAVIPREVLQAAGYLKIGLYGVYGDSVKATVWTPMLPVEQGTDTTGQQPAPSEETPWQHAVEQMAADLEASQAAREDAEAAATEAATYVENASAMAQDAEQSASGAASSAEAAASSAATSAAMAQGAGTAQTAAETAQAAAESAEESAEQHAASAGTAAESASDSAAAAAAAQAAAEQAASTIDATVTKNGSTATITITDADGTQHTAQISDGVPGQPGLPGQPGEKGDPGDDAPQIDDTQASTEHPWSGAKVSQEISQLSSQKVDKNQGTAHAGKYLKIGDDGMVAPGEGGGGASYTAGYGISISESNVISVSFTNAEQEAF